jgi:hypothetical protein
MTTAPGRTLTERIPEASEARVVAAEMVGVNAHYVSDAKRLFEEAPATFDAVESGALGLPAASTTQPIYVQRAADSAGRG